MPNFNELAKERAVQRLIKGAIRDEGHVRFRSQFALPNLSLSSGKVKFERCWNKDHSG